MKHVRVFSVDVLMENYHTAFEPDGSLRVWFGGYDQPQEREGETTEVAGIMLVPEPTGLLLLGLGMVGIAGIRRKLGK